MGTRIEAVSALTSRGLRKPTARRLADAGAEPALNRHEESPAISTC